MIFNKKTEQHQRRRKLKRDAKYFLTILILIIGGLLMYSMYNNSSNTITSAAIGEPREDEKLFAISTDLTIPDLEFNGKDLVIEIMVKKHNGKISINDLQFSNFEKPLLIISNYDGKVSFDNSKTLSLYGKASKTVVNGVRIDNEGESLDINSENMGFNSIKISNLNLNMISFDSSKGTIEIVEKGSFDVNNEKTTISPYRGNLFINDSRFILQGKSNNLEIESAPQVNIEL